MTAPFLDPDLLMRLGVNVPGMTPGQSPAPASLPSPNIPPPTLPLAPPASRMDRVRHALSQIPSALMPTPPALEGLLSDGDLSSARHQALLDMGLSLLGNAHGQGGGNAPSTAQALAGALQTGRQSFGGNLSNTIQSAMALGEYKRQQQVRQARGQILGGAATGGDASPSGRMTALLNALPQLLAIGDMEGASTIEKVISGGHELLSSPKLEHIDRGDRIDAIDPRTGQIVQSYGKASNLEHIDRGDRIDVIDPKSGAVVRSYAKAPTPKNAADVDATTKFGAEQTNKILDDFRADTNKYDEAARGYHVLQGAMGNPGMSSPFAVLDAYARVINPGATVRLGTMQVLKDMGSADQRVQRWLEQTRTGQWPKGMVDDIKRQLDGIMREHANDYYDKRKKAILRGTRAGVDVAPLLGDSFNGLNIGYTPGASGAAPAAPAVAIDPILAKHLKAVQERQR